MSKNTHKPTFRLDYKQHEGAATFTYINAQLLEYVSNQPIKPVKRYSETPARRTISSASPAALGLYAVQDTLRNPIRRVQNIEAITDLCNLSEETTNNMYRGTESYYGIGDLDFTWHFAPAVAANITYYFTDIGVLSEEQRDSFTLTDYADIISTGWFSDLIHNMARTKNGVYRGHGKFSGDYQPNDLQAHLSISTGSASLLSFSELYEHYELADPDDGYTYHAAKLAPGMLQTLRRELKKESAETRGCPVARHNITVDNKAIEHDEVLQHAQDEGILVPSGKQLRHGSERTHFTLEYSAIDSALILLAQRLVAYEEAYGIPYVSPGIIKENIWKHTWRPPVNALYYKSTEVQ